MKKQTFMVPITTILTLVILSGNVFAQETRQDRLKAREQRIEKKIENASVREERAEQRLKEKANRAITYPRRKMARVAESLRLKKQRIARRERLWEKKAYTGYQKHKTKVMNTK